MALTHGELFAGISGFGLGFGMAGIETLWQVEIDARCNEVLAHHWPDVRRYGDIRHVGEHNLEPVGVISGGFPCTDLSVAGRRAGLAGKRSGLWWEMLRVIEELRPTWVVIENVPGLRSSWSSTESPPREVQVRDFAQKSDAERRARSLARDWEMEETSDLETILASLGQLGYWWAYRSLDAQYCNLAQRRERVFIVGCLGDLGGLGGAQSGQDVSGLAGLPAKVLFEPESLSWDSAPSRGEGKGVTAPLKASSPSQRAGGSWPVAEEFVVLPFDTTQITSSLNRSNPKPGDPCHPLSASAHAPAIVQYASAGFGAYRQQPGTLRASGGDAGAGSEVLIVQDDIVKHALSGHNQRNDPDGEHFVVAGTLGSRQRNDLDSQGAYVPVAFDWQSGGDVRLNVSSEHTSALQASQTPAVLESMGVRRLTVTECERLQGFSDGFSAVGRASDTARYKMLGNAVAVPVAQWLAERILRVGKSLY